ncbi:MAG: hypothetical protein RRZ73_03450, partial [Oscillospiraceae bacterium]
VAVAIPVFNNVTNKAQVNACVTTQRTIESAIQMAKAEGVDLNLEDPFGPIPWDLLVPKYIAEKPMCPVKESMGKETYNVTIDGIVFCSQSSGKLKHDKTTATNP